MQKLFWTMIWLLFKQKPTKRYQKFYPWSIATNKMKQEIEAYYRQIKLDIVDAIESELARIKNEPDVQHW